MKMANTSHIQFEGWSPDQVAAWLRGLDEAVGQYVQHFHNNGIDGKKLLMITHSDLEKLSVSKLGHQELILEAVDLLRAMRYGHDTENLQHLALQLGCKARSLHNMVQAITGENDKNRANVSHHDRRKQLTVEVLSAMADLLSTLKCLVSWLDRAPFEGIHDMCLLRNTIVKFGMELVHAAQRDSNLTETEESIMRSCRMLFEICDDLVMNSKEPLVVQPASLEVATIRKKQPEELGLHISSSYYGIHAISGIKELSPADLCRKIEKGDEVIQVNYQTVLGWQLKKLVETLKEKPKEVVLLLKKRPRHISPFGNLPNRKNKQHAQAATLPKILKKRRSREGDAKQTRPSLQEFTSSAPSGDIYVTKDAPENTDGNDTDNDVFRSGSESPQFTLPVGVDPKHRRATVSGGSPTLERPSLVIQDLDPPTRPKSQFVNSAEKEAAMAALAASENRLGVAKIWDDKSKEMSELTASENQQRIEKFAAKVSQHMTVDSPSSTTESPQASVSEDSPETVETQDQKSVEVRRQEFRVTKPTPHVLENPYISVGRPYSQSKEVVSEVATDNNLRDQPTLMKIKRIDSSSRSEEMKLKEEQGSPKEKKHVGFAADCKEESEESVSYTHIVVGGVVQKIPVDKSQVFVSDSPTVRRRAKTGTKRLDRRVSCKDLGKGDCEGWLLKRKMSRGILSKSWAKRWCILKTSNLFYYKEKDDLKAEGVIHLPAFQVSPATDIKTKKSAFKIHNPGTTFYFASERQDDMSKWMNKMGLAAINFDTSRVITTGGFIKPEPRSPHPMGVQNIYYSESEDEGDDASVGSQMGSQISLVSQSSTCSSNTLSGPSIQEVGGSTSTLVPAAEPSVPVEKRRKDSSVSSEAPSGSPDDLTGILRNLQGQNLTIDGIDRERLRRSHITSADLLKSSRGQLSKLRKLQSLQRTLKAKQMELSEINHFFEKPLTHELIREFKEHYTG
ncbi:connector enhancer of kinase suppressor of ras 2-like isoform X1 [Haliotis asinina]|uniref:connector enhancer of kinase suppressor of ras 2-like isoform X1 n=2 Tax=Haliotis asinina TaxID=109174 RepID=UPI003531E4C7